MRLEKTLAALAVALLRTAPLPAQDQVDLTIDATMDIYRAGGYNDGSDGIAPVVFSFPAHAWRTMTFPSAGGAWTCSPPVPEYGPDGTSLSTGCLPPSGNNMNPIGTFSGYDSTDFTGAMVGMFLADALPPAAPASLRFYNTDNSKGGIATDFKILKPLIGQVFFIGDGLTGTGIGNIQVFDVPPTATHLYLGYVDSCNGGPVPSCYSDNLGSMNVTARLQQYAPDWVKSTLSSAPSVRCCVGLAYDAATDSTVLFGGGNGGLLVPRVRYGDTWIWRNGWYQLSPATAPSPRLGVGTAFDPTTGTVVLFGGNDINGNLLNDTWTWNGITWTQEFPALSPPARELDEQSMVYDAATGTVVLFGGGGNSGSLADTWEWNGPAKTWTQLFPRTSPSARSTPLAYDAANKEVVLFSGGANNSNDTWTWNGVTWTQRFPAASPPYRGLPSLAYDPGLAQVVLFGGSQGPPTALNDSWTWNGNTWTQLRTYTQPGGRWAAGMVFDPFNRGLLLFGGELVGDPFGNDTWLLVHVLVR